MADNETDRDIGRLEGTVEQLQERMDDRFDNLESRMNERFDGFGDRFDAVSDQFSGVDSRFDGVDRQFEGVDVEVLLFSGFSPLHPTLYRLGWFRGLRSGSASLSMSSLASTEDETQDGELITHYTRSARPRSLHSWTSLVLLYRPPISGLSECRRHPSSGRLLI